VPLRVLTVSQEMMRSKIAPHFAQERHRLQFARDRAAVATGSVQLTINGLKLL